MADFLRAEFSGSGDLSGYTPELGSLVHPAAILDGPGNEDTGYPDTALTDYERGSGGVKLDMALTPQDQAISLMTNDPVSADYALEIEIDLATCNGTTDSLQIYGVIAGRCTAESSYGYWNQAGLWFTIEYNDPGIYVSWRPVLRGQDLGGASFDEVGDWDGFALASGAAQTVKIRVEWEGNTMRAFINDDPLEQYGFTDWTWSGSSIFDAAGKTGISLWYQNDPQEGVGLSTTVLGRMLGTYDLIPPPILPGQFWTSNVKCTEVIGAAALMLAAEPPPPAPPPPRELEVYDLPGYGAPPPVVNVVTAALNVNADFAGVNGTLLSNYVDLLGNTFYLPYFSTGFTDINYTLQGGALSGLNPVFAEPGGSDDRIAYATFIIPGSDVTVETSMFLGADIPEIWLVARASYMWTSDTIPPYSSIYAKIFPYWSGTQLYIVNDKPGGYQQAYINLAEIYASSTLNIKLTVIGNTAKLYLNGVEKLSLSPLTVLASGYAGFSGSHWSDNDALMDYFKVWSEDPPGAFWTDRMRCTEVVT